MDLTWFICHPAPPTTTRWTATSSSSSPTRTSGSVNDPSETNGSIPTELTARAAGSDRSLLNDTNSLVSSINSINDVIGRFQLFKTPVTTPSLAQYIEIQKGTTLIGRGAGSMTAGGGGSAGTVGGARVFLFAEGLSRSTVSLSQYAAARNGVVEDIALLRSWAFQILDGLIALSKLGHGVIHGRMSPDNILVDKSGNIKLSDYAIGYITRNGSDVTFPIGHPDHVPPEVLCGIAPPGPRSDTWALGSVLLESFLGVAHFRSVDWCCNFSVDTVPSLIRLLTPKATPDPEFNQFIDFVQACLWPSAVGAPTIYDLRMHPFLHKCQPMKVSSTQLSVAFTEWTKYYHFWKISGQYPEQALRSHDEQLILSVPIARLPIFISVEDDSPEHVLGYSLGRLFSETPIEVQMPVRPDMAVTTQEAVSLAMLEKDLSYQSERIQVFSVLLKEFPLSKNDLQREASKDVPPFLRSAIWAALLGVIGDPQYDLDAIDTDTETSSDRQLELDIPRCHQYNELLSCQLGHQKMKRILKAWIVSQSEGMVYWQGLDSLLAPFVTIHFNDDALAFSCFSALVQKYQRGVFLPDNSKALKSLLRNLLLVISFHDAQLAAYLNQIELTPELFAIPWFMTLFAHIFQLDRIYILWDAILSRSPAFIIFIAYSILHLLRDVLLHRDFSSCLVVFSEPLSIDVEKCITVAVAAFRVTPASLLDYSLGEPQSALSGWISPNEFYTIKDRSLLIDLRSTADFKSGHFRQSVVLHAVDNHAIVMLQLLTQKHQFLVVLDSTGRHQRSVGDQLVLAQFSRVCSVATPPTFFEGVDCQCSSEAQVSFLKCVYC